MKFKVRMQNWTHLQFNNSVRTCVLEVQWHSELTTCHCITTLELPSCKPLGYLPSQKHCPQKQNGKSKAVRDWGRMFYKKVVTALPLQNCSHSNEHVLSGWTCKIESLQLQTMCQSASYPVQKMQARNPQLIFFAPKRLVISELPNWIFATMTQQGLNNPSAALAAFEFQCTHRLCALLHKTIRNSYAKELWVNLRILQSWLHPTIAAILIPGCKGLIWVGRFVP